MDDIIVDTNLHQTLLQVPITTSSKSNQRSATIRQFSHIAAGVCIVLFSLGLLGTLFFSGGRGKSDTMNSAPKADAEKTNSSSKDIASESIQKSGYKDQPVYMTQEDSTTYTRFVNIFEEANNSYTDDSTLDYPASEFQDEVPIQESTSEIKDTLIGKLPKSLQYSEFLQDRSLDIKNKKASLSSYYYLSTDTMSGRLIANVHPILDFEKDLLISAEDKLLYSLNPIENPKLPADMKDYSNLLLYPIFTTDTLSKDAIVSRLNISGQGTKSISFGVYKNGYVITYEALGLDANGLAELILN